MILTAPPIDPATGGAIAVILSVAGYGVWRLMKLVLDSNERVSDRNAKALDELETRHEKFLSNHMGENVRVQRDLVEQVRLLREHIMDDR